MAWVNVAVATVAVVGGVVGAQGAKAAGDAQYAAGQVEYAQEKQRTHYEAKIMQRQALQSLHMNFAKAGASGVAVGEGSPMVMAMADLSNLQEDKANLYRNGAKNAQKFWQAGADGSQAAKYKATGSLLAGASGAASAAGKMDFSSGSTPT